MLAEWYSSKVRISGRSHIKPRLRLIGTGGLLPKVLDFWFPSLGEGKNRVCTLLDPATHMRIRMIKVERED